MEGRSKGRQVATEDVVDYGRGCCVWEEGHKGAKERNMRKKSCIDDYKQRRPLCAPRLNSLAFHTAVFVFLSFHFELAG